MIGDMIGNMIGDAITDASAGGNHDALADFVAFNASLGLDNCLWFNLFFLTSFGLVLLLEILVVFEGEFP